MKSQWSAVEQLIAIQVAIIAGLVGYFFVWKHTTPGLVDMLRSGTNEERRLAARDLGKKGDQARGALPGLTEALTDGNAGVQVEAAEAMVRIGGIAAAETALASASPYVRGAAIRALGSLFSSKDPAETERRVELLVRGLEDPDSMVNGSAIQGLYNLGPAAARAVPRVAALVEDARGHLNGVALEMLRNLGDVPAVPAQLASPHADNRVIVVRQLAMMGDAALPALGAALSDPAPRVVEQVIRSLELMGTDGARRVLAEAANNPDVAIQTKAKAALERLNRRGSLGIKN